jgi:serine/threonine protein kinase
MGPSDQCPRDEASVAPSDANDTEVSTTPPAFAPEEPAPTIETGQVLAGKYEITRALGSGGMGKVFAARHRELGQLVAINAP